MNETTSKNYVLMIATLVSFLTPFMGSVSKRTYGVASATLATMRQTGMTLSMGVVMFLFALYIGRAEITPEQHGLFLESAKVAFIVFGCSCFVGIFASLASGDVR